MFYTEEWMQLTSDAVYSEMRERLKGKIKVKIIDNYLVASVTCDEFYYSSKVDDIATAVSRGFDPRSFVNDLIRDYRKMVAVEINARLFNYN